MRCIFLAIIILIQTIGFSQKSLSLKDAVSIALKNNFDLLVAGYTVDEAKTNNTLGNAGMLPKINLSGNGLYEHNKSYQKFASGLEYNNPSLTTNSLNAAAELSWSLFDGGKMFVTRKKLDEIYVYNQLTYKEKVSQTIFDVVSAYFLIVCETNKQKYIADVIEFNKARNEIALTGFKAGLYSKTDFLLAQIDLNTATENLISQTMAVLDTRRALSNVLSHEIDSNLVLTDSLKPDLNFSEENLLEKLEASNPLLLSLKKNIDISGLAIKELQTAYLPQAGIKAGYYASQTQNSAGNLLLNHYTGPEISGSIVFPLFNGGETRRKTNMARIEMKKAELQYESTRFYLSGEIQRIAYEYRLLKKQYLLETETFSMTRENLSIMLHRLHLGQSTAIESHQAQELFSLSGNRLIFIEYQLKLSEIKLKQLAAELDENKF